MPRPSVTLAVVTSLIAASAASATAQTSDTTTAKLARNLDLSTRDGRLLVGGVAIHQTTDEFQGTEVAGAPDKLWAVLPAVYEQLGLTLNAIDTDKQAVAAVNLRAAIQLAKVRISNYIDCGGAGSIAGRAADSYSITFNIATQLVPTSATRTEVRTLVQAFGRPNSMSGSAIHCTSTGKLEAKVAALAASRAAQ